MTTRLLGTLAVVLVLAVLGCAGADTSSETKADSEVTPEATPVTDNSASTMDPKVERAVTVARAIRKAPAQAEAILAEAKMTAEELDDLLYEISMNPEHSRQYAEALKSP